MDISNYTGHTVGLDHLWWVIQVSNMPLAHAEVRLYFQMMDISNTTVQPGSGSVICQCRFVRFLAPGVPVMKNSIEDENFSETIAMETGLFITSCHK